MGTTTDVINTSTLAKLYRTTTSDIEKKLTTMGHKPVRTVIQQSGRRFMVWDRKAVLKALDDYKARRLEMLQQREVQRKELAEKQTTVPRTGYGTQDHLMDAPSDFAGLEETVKVPAKDFEKLQAELAELQRQMAEYLSKKDA